MKKLLLAASVLALAACGQQATTTDTTADSATQTPAAPAVPQMSAAEFAGLAAASDQFEIQSSELAGQHAQRAEVKTFAQHMVTAHRGTTQELTSLLQANNMTAPSPTLNAQQQSTLDNLRNQSGAAFDTAYVQAQVQAHQMAVQTFENFANNGEAGPVRDWAQRTLPTLRQHLQDAQGLSQAS